MKGQMVCGGIPMIEIIITILYKCTFIGLWNWKDEISLRKRGLNE
jgi:hypothetical protein